MPARTSAWICALLLACCSGQAFAIEPDPCIPPDSTFAMKIRPRQILTSALVRELGWDELLKNSLAANGPVQEFLDTAGLRIDRDLESILWCQSCSPYVAHFYRTSCIENLDTGEVTNLHSLTNQPLAPGEKDAVVTGLVLLEGRFKPKSLIRAIERHGKQAGAPVRKTSYLGEPLVQVDTPKGPLFIAFQGTNKIIVSNQKTVIRGCLEGGYDKPISPKMAKCLERVSETDSIWAVHAFDTALLQGFSTDAVLDSQENDLLASVKEDLLFGQISIQISDGIQTRMGFSTKSLQAKTVLEKLAKYYIERVGHGIDQAFVSEKAFRKGDPVSLNLILTKLRVSVIYVTAKHGRFSFDDGIAGVNARAGRKKLDPLLSFIHPDED